MATITDKDILKNLSQGENIFVASANEVKQLKVNAKDWDPASSLAEGSVTEIGETYKAVNGEHVAILEVAAAVSGSINSTTQFATSNNILKTQLVKLDPVSSNSGVAVLDGVVYKRKFEGEVGTSNFVLSSNPGNMYVNEDHATSTSAAHGYGFNNNITIIGNNTNTIRFERYFGPAQVNSIIPTQTVFYISSTNSFTNIDTGVPVKAGFYINVGAGDLNLGPDTFKNDLNDGSTLRAVGENPQIASNPTERANVPVINDITLLSDGTDGITNITSVLEDLASPSDTNDFWEKKPALTAPVGAAGSVTAGMFWTDETSSFANTATAKYWDTISEGLVDDVTKSNSDMWQEFSVTESTDSLIYRS
jgi:hypothetical protein